MRMTIDDYRRTYPAHARPTRAQVVAAIQQGELAGEQRFDRWWVLEDRAAGAGASVNPLLLRVRAS